MRRFFCNCYYDVLGMLTVCLDDEKGEIILEDDGAGHEKMKVNLTPLSKVRRVLSGFESLLSLRVGNHNARL